MTIPSEMLSACAKIIGYSGEVVGMAFLISSRYALTSAYALKVSTDTSTNVESVLLEFPLKRYMAKVEAFDKDLNCAVLLLERPVEDITPVVLGVNVVFGDTGTFYGFPRLLKGAGVLFEGQIQETYQSPETKQPSRIILT